MGQMKKKSARKISLRNSLKWRILLYMPIPVLLAVMGTYQIGYLANDWQSWYIESFFTGNDYDISEEEAKTYSVLYEGKNYTVYETENGVKHYVFHNSADMTVGEKIRYQLITFAQGVMTILWVILCLAAGGYFYYKRELEKPIRLLLYSAEQITDNCLDFKMDRTKPSELGMVCDAFEKMRESLYETNQENFRILEERRRLNAAFAHDMRNPVTVLKGYADLLERYVPDGSIGQEKELEIIGMLQRQILRLENYVQKMSVVQKLEDLMPACENIGYDKLILLCRDTAKMIDERVIVRIQTGGVVLTGGTAGSDRMSEPDVIPGSDCTKEPAVTLLYLDKELVLEVLENLIFNASAHTKDRITLTITCRRKEEETELSLCVEDNGAGFSEEALQMAGRPFYREENRKDRQHFGLGLYICRLICEKCGGRLSIKNGAGETGGVVTAVFACSFPDGEEQIKKSEKVDKKLKNIS